MSKNNSKLIRHLIMLVIVCVTITLFQMLLAQGPPPSCGGQTEPTSNPFCGTGGPDRVCNLSDPCSGSQYGNRYGYCCQESLSGCKEIQGRYKCCNNVWKTECIVIVDIQGSACDSSWKHCL